MNDVIVQAAMLILTGLAGFVVKTIKDYLYKEGGEKALRIVEIVAKNAVNAVEQIAEEDTKGYQKLSEAKAKARKSLEAHNIYLTDSQLEMFIEAAVKEMNDAWKGESK